MAISATTEWDIRTTGSDSNAGGFDKASSGTDYSQQDAAQITYTDLVIGSTTTQLSSVANPFTSAHVGNIINVTAGTGFTVQRVQVVSVAGGVATCDKACGTASSTGGQGKLGGGLATIGAFLANGAAGNTCHIKAGTYAVTATQTVDWNTRFGGAVVSFIGYGSTHNDNGTKPLITTATNSVTLFAMNQAASNSIAIFRNLSLSNTAASRSNGFWANGLGSLIIVDTCILDGFDKGVNGDDGSSTYSFMLVMFNCEVKNCLTAGVVNGAASGSSSGFATIQGCYFHNNGIAINFNEGGYASVTRCVIDHNTTGIQSPGPLIRIQECSISFSTGDGIVFTSSGAVPIIVNSIIYGNGGWGINQLNTQGHMKYMCHHNAYGANTSGDRRNFTAGSGDVALTANPFVSSTNLNLNSTAGGGTACKGAAAQYPFP